MAGDEEQESTLRPLYCSTPFASTRRGRRCLSQILDSQPRTQAVIDEHNLHILCPLYIHPWIPLGFTHSSRSSLNVAVKRIQAGPRYRRQAALPVTEVDPVSLDCYVGALQDWSDGCDRAGGRAGEGGSERCRDKAVDCRGMRCRADGSLPCTLISYIQCACSLWLGEEGIWCAPLSHSSCRQRQLILCTPSRRRACFATSCTRVGTAPQPPGRRAIQSCAEVSYTRLQLRNSSLTTRRTSSAREGRSAATESTHVLLAPCEATSRPASDRNRP